MKKYVNTAMITSGSVDDFNKRLASTMKLKFSIKLCSENPLNIFYTPL